MEIDNYLISEIKKTIFTSWDGRTFNINDSSWVLNKNVIITVKWMSKLYPIVKSSLKVVLARLAEEYAAETVKNLNNSIKQYFNITGDRELLVNSLISYRSSLSNDEELNLSKIRMLVRNWAKWGYPGISLEVYEFLNSLRLRGLEKGPLTDIEMNALIDAMLQAYISNKITTSDYALSATIVYTGRRPIQITSLKNKDIYSRNSEKIKEYWINFPRAKQRFSKWRTAFNAYPITEDLWDLLTLHIRQTSCKIAKLINFELSSQIIQELPLFPDFDEIRIRKDYASFTAAMNNDTLHINRNFCNNVMKKISIILNVYSERTGKKLNLFIRRFRYTLGSNIAREGKGELVIAEALDHSDTQNVGVYVKNLPDVVERIDKAVALHLSPLAQAFQGVLVNSESDAKRGKDPKSRIGNASINVGSCGSYGFCNAMAPMVCYTCKHFQPWLYGPHDLILNELIEKRNSIFLNTKDIKIASSNDRLILAVAQVIRLCNAKKAEQLYLGVS